MALLRSTLCLAAVGMVAATYSGGPVVISGATGRTGSLAYATLKSHNVPVRALVRNASKAKELLQCTKCDESEGIFVGDVTKPETMVDAMKGAGALVILTSAIPHCDQHFNCNYPKGAYPIDIDWNGGKNQIEAFVKGAGGLKPVILVSAMGTTAPDTFLDKMGNGQIGFYKLNIEAFLMAADLPYTIVKPCGLGDGEPTKDTLLVGHDDEEDWDLKVPVQRADVARVVAAAVEGEQHDVNFRFDLCAKAGSPTTDADLPALLHAAEYPWQQAHVVV